MEKFASQHELESFMIYSVTVSIPLICTRTLTTQLLAANLDNPEIFKRIGRYKFTCEQKNPPKMSSRQINFLPNKNVYCYSSPNDLRLCHHLSISLSHQSNERQRISMRCSSFYSDRTAVLFLRAAGRKVQKRLDSSTQIGLKPQLHFFCFRFRMNPEKSKSLEKEDMDWIAGPNQDNKVDMDWCTSADEQGRYRQMNLNNFKHIAKKLTVFIYSSSNPMVCVSVSNPLSNSVVLEHILEIIQWIRSNLMTKT